MKRYTDRRALEDIFLLAHIIVIKETPMSFVAADRRYFFDANDELYKIIDYRTQKTTGT